jgi:hypothetical protein
MLITLQNRNLLFESSFIVLLMKRDVILLVCFSFIFIFIIFQDINIFFEKYITITFLYLINLQYQYHFIIISTKILKL